MAKYCVPVYFTGMDNFIVEAATPSEARDKARELFNGGEQPDECGNEYHTIDAVGTPELVQE